MARKHRENLDDIAELQRENNELSSQVARQEVKLRAARTREAQLTAAQDELRASEQERTRQALYIDQLAHELRDASAERERLRTILAGASWFQAREQLEAPLPAVPAAPAVRS